MSQMFPLFKRCWFKIFFLTAIFLSSLALSSVEDCGGCHQKQLKSWQKSHHAKAMQLATPETVLGDFNNRLVKKGLSKVRFTIEEKQFIAYVQENENTKAQRYILTHTFGWRPLQQYLVAFPNGKYQVLPYMWDSRSKQAGGQNWIYLYDDWVPPTDRLHWHQATQNWNGMCADCHSDALQRNYQADTNAFASTWQEITVGCMSCHDDIGKDHANKDHIHSPKKEQSVTFGMEACFACHALRAPLRDGFKSTDRFLDAFNPNFLSRHLYHADGQINEEAYVYGSFLQSKMHGAGVTCLDCHDAHSYELKRPGNATCTYCHAQSDYDLKRHTGHSKNSEGGACVNCHMPATTYMKVDERRDHSFKIPRPEWTERFGVPNACNRCHLNKPSSWAAKAINIWYPEKSKPNADEETYLVYQSGQRMSAPTLLALAGKTSLSIMHRATLIESLPETTDFLSGAQLQVFLQHSEPLLRLAAVRAARVLVEPEKAAYISSLLSDEFRSVRVSAYEQLIGIPLSPQQKKVFDVVKADFETAQHQILWRGEGQLNKALIFQKLGDHVSAIENYRQALTIDPYFEPAYINLADIYRELKQPGKVSAVLQKGLNTLPNSASLYYSQGLYFVRQKNMKAAVNALLKAKKLAPNNQRYAYTYQLALEQLSTVN